MTDAEERELFLDNARRRRAVEDRDMSPDACRRRAYEWLKEAGAALREEERKKKMQIRGMKVRCLRYRSAFEECGGRFALEELGRQMDGVTEAFESRAIGDSVLSMRLRRLACLADACAKWVDGLRSSPRASMGPY